MANYHVLNGTDDGNAFQVVMHVPIPGTGNNRANIQWRTALANSKLKSTSVLTDGDGTGGTISAAEKASLASGAVYESLRTVSTNPGETAAALVVRLDALYAAVSTDVQAKLQKALTYFGYASNP